MSSNPRNNLSFKPEFPLTDKIVFVGTPQAVTIRFQSLRQIGIDHMGVAYNMQSNEACFEGWAAAFKSQCPEATITLVLEEGLTLPMGELYPKEPEEATTQGAGGICLEEGRSHYHRFLYRALRFWEQYGVENGGWFVLAEPLLSAAKNLGRYISHPKISLYNNIPGADAKAKAMGDDESMVEELFENNRGYLAQLLEVQAGFSVSEGFAVFRQLPVGLFLKEKRGDVGFFSGKKSMADLWGLHGQELLLFELKHKRTPIGAISELFFYANYLWDMFGQNGVGPTVNFEPQRDENYGRGYPELYRAYEKGLHRIDAFLLTDSRHPTQKGRALWDLMNKSTASEHIFYGVLDYKLSALRGSQED